MTDTTRLPRYSSIIRSERELRGWSQARLAEELGTTPGTVSNWERGLIMPSAYFRERLCQIFAKDAAQLGLIGESQEAPSCAPTVVAREAGFQPGWSNRLRFIEKLAACWVRGVLEPSQAALPDLTLRLALEPGAVTSLESELPAAPPAPAGLLPKGFSLLDCYDQALGELLLLGEAGAGKTTLLLSLLRELLARAKEDEHHPLPVVFLLASWGKQQLPLEDWLLQELRRLYQVPARLARAWLRAEQILPLLDGLDELPASQCSACIRAINAYRNQHGLLPLVVTCRSQVYYAQPERLCLRQAVVVQPLTAAYVQAYLTQGAGAAQRGDSLALDPSLLEMITSPFLLAIARKTLEEGERIAGSCEESGEQEKELIGRYVEQLMARIQRRYGLPPVRLRRLLGWVAQQLLLQSQAELVLEQVQASWLPFESWARRCWKPITDALTGLFFGLVSTLLFGMILIGPYSTVEAYQTYLGPGLLAGLAAGLATSSLGGDRSLRARTPRALLTGAIFALVFGLLLEPLAGLVFGSLASLLVWSGMVRHYGGQIELIEPPSWSYWLLLRRLKRWAPLLLSCLVLGGFSLTALFLSVEKSSPVVALCGAWLALLLLSLSASLVGSFLGGLSWTVLAQPKFVRPTEGIWRAGRYALLTGLSALLITIILLMASFGLVSLLGSFMMTALNHPLLLIYLPYSFRDFLLFSLFILLPGAAIGLALTWNYGGAAVLQHVLLRLFLSATGCLPWRAVDHLEIAVAEGLLRRAGGAYLFSHRLLLEYFAAAC